MFKKTIGIACLISIFAIGALAQEEEIIIERVEPNADNLPMRGLFTTAFGTNNMNTSFLGVTLQEISTDNFAKFSLPAIKGVGVLEVSKDSPAEKAGILKGDVITSYEGESITSVSKLTRLIRETSPGHSVKITVLRKGNEKVLGTTIEKREAPKWVSKSTKADGVEMSEPFIRRILVSSSNSIGAKSIRLTTQLGEYFGVPNGEGILISEVKKDGPAAKGGLMAGDVITAVDGKKVTSLIELSKAMNSEEPKEMTVTVIRNKKAKEMKVTPEKMKNENMFFFEPESGFGPMYPQKDSELKDGKKVKKIIIMKKDGENMPEKIVEEEIVIDDKDNK